MFLVGNLQLSAVPTCSTHNATAGARDVRWVFPEELGQDKCVTAADRN